MTTTTHPFSITAPATMTLAPDSHGMFTVTNSGTEAITVHESAGRYTVRSLQYPASSHATATALGRPWITVWPQTFTLAPGRSEVVHISDHVPAGVHGNHWLNAVWTARPAHAGHGNLHLDGAVATTIEVPMPGIAVPVTGHGLPHAPAAPPHGGDPAGLILGLALAGLAIVAAIGYALTRRGRGGHKGPRRRSTDPRPIPADGPPYGNMLARPVPRGLAAVLAEPAGEAPDWWDSPFYRAPCDGPDSLPAMPARRPRPVPPVTTRDGRPW